MKRFFIFFNTLIALLFLCSCNANNQIKTTSLKPIYAMDTIIYINFYNILSFITFKIIIRYENYI